VYIISPFSIIPGTSAPNGFSITTLLQEMQASAEKSLEDLAEEKVPKAIQLRTIVLLGRPAQEIVNLADRENVDIIVLSTHGESGWQKFISGSVAERVVRWHPARCWQSKPRIRRLSWLRNLVLPTLYDVEKYT
jgi:nucleotide-binding universal stress UspA family protein